MSKKAVLVNFGIKTRVIVDIPEGKTLDDDEVFDMVSDAAIKQIKHYAATDDSFPYPENIIEIDYDYELPYGEAPEDK